MKIKAEWVLGLIGTAILGVLGFIGSVVWDGVQIAEDNKVRLESLKENQSELRTDVKELRRELYAVYPALSDVAEASGVGTEVR